MARTRFRNDRGLTARMGVVATLLVVLYLGVTAGLVVALPQYSVLIALIAIGLGWAQWYYSDKVAVRVMRAREVTAEQAPELHAVIDRLVALADMPKPRVAVSDTDLPNAFATGRSPSHSVVCVTTGLLRRLDADEVEAVLAHELSHVAHRDVSVMTVASTLGVLAGLIMRWGLFFGGGGRDRNNAVVFIAVWVASIAVYAISFLLTRALSRYRELSADRAAAYLTGRPSALASALTKISGDIARIPSRDLRAAEPMNAFFIAPALSGRSVGALFSTHPPLEQRLAQLAQVSTDLGRPTG
ncbi:MAG: zinc metalloprotease HtpX [Nocardioidaceae bacterium]|nr:zinc metalloprotease HtpX [Nocardioidaceae bacterium]